jgi:hypothetical protein
MYISYITIDTDVEWSTISKLLMGLSILFSFCQIMERPDFIGLLLSISMFYFSINMHKIGFYEIASKIKLLVNATIINIFYDFLWLVFYYKVSIL